jgi:hypothetical protein
MELRVVLDCRTRWNTLERMIERFFKDPKYDKNCITIAEARSLMERGILLNCERYVKLRKNCSIGS